MSSRSHWKTGGAILAMLAATLTAALPAQACTSFLLRASDGTPVYGRTMEFGFQLSSEMIVIPRQFGLSATGPDGKVGGGMPWKAKYAAVGLNAFDLPVLTDGMNEKGLTGGILYFPDYVGYADPKTADPKTAMAPWDFLTWALTNFATVAEVREAAKGIAIIDIVEPTMGIVPPFHYTLHDATGASLVVEPVGGTLKIYDNPLGVMTNAPEFDWHLTNLKNYVKLSPFNAPALDLWGQTISSFGQGSGLLGMPGDPTPAVALHPRARLHDVRDAGRAGRRQRPPRRAHRQQLRHSAWAGSGPMPATRRRSSSRSGPPSATSRTSSTTSRPTKTRCCAAST